MDEQRKRVRKILILTAVCAVVAALAAFIVKDRLKREPVTLVFVGYTNDAGRMLCLFRGENGNHQTITYSTELQLAQPAWTSYRSGGEAPAGETFTFSMSAPTNATTWQLCFSYNTSPTKWEGYRQLCAGFFWRHNMPAIARKISPRLPGVRSVVVAGFYN